MQMTAYVMVPRLTKRAGIRRLGRRCVELARQRQYENTSEGQARVDPAKPENPRMTRMFCVEPPSTAPRESTRANLAERTSGVGQTGGFL
jgi:hypothetical protein